MRAKSQLKCKISKKMNKDYQIKYLNYKNKIEN